MGGRGDARPGPLPLGSASAALRAPPSSSEAAAARALVTQPVAQPPPPPLPPAEATHATPLPGHCCPKSACQARSRETISLYRDIPAAARRMSREACVPWVGGAEREEHAPCVERGSKGWEGHKIEWRGGGRPVGGARYLLARASERLWMFLRQGAWTGLEQRPLSHR